MGGKEISLFLDSGAYSACTPGVEINLQEYIKFVHEWKDALDVYAVLDDIRDPRKTWENQREMERQGLKPLPTYHYGEDPAWLKKYLDRYDYIAIRGMVPVPNASLVPWLDQLFNKYLTDQKGNPTVKVHGFGMSSILLMRQYPWWSVDTTSWVRPSQFGSIYIPDGSQGLCLGEGRDRRNGTRVFLVSVVRRGS